MLGRFLEYSVRTSDILGSYAFYLALGFTGVDGSEAFGYRYGVVTDGRIAIGLHEAPVPDLALTFVHNDLAAHARALRAAGLVPDQARLGEEHLHELTLPAPDRTCLRLIEARTFSPLGRNSPSGLGWFEELAVPTRDTTVATAYYEALGFVSTPGEQRTVLAIDGLTIGLTIGLTMGGPSPRQALCFATPAVDEVADRLERLGIGARPVDWFGNRGLEIVTPDDTRLIVSSGHD